MMPDFDAMPERVGPLIQYVARCLDGDQARREAEMLLQHLLGVGRAWLFAHADEALSAQTRHDYAALLARRMRGEPLAHITGKAGFWSLSLGVSPATLIPRPETEVLVEAALERIVSDADADIADLGTGSGAIALALAFERPHARVLATDFSVAALRQAEANARTNGIENVRFAQGDWCQALGVQCFDLIVSNPPYIAAADPHLERGDLRFEPGTALISGVDGLDAIRQIVSTAPAHLNPGGWLLLEHGWDQGEAVRELLREAGFEAVATRRDLEARERVSLGRKPQP